VTAVLSKEIQLSRDSSKNTADSYLGRLSRATRCCIFFTSKFSQSRGAGHQWHRAQRNTFEFSSPFNQYILCERCRNITAKAISQLGKSCPKLEEIHIFDSPIENEKFFNLPHTIKIIREES
jgi:hypothetical protein